MSSKINIYTFQQSMILDEELSKFSQYIAEKSGKYQLSFSTCRQESIFSYLLSGNANIIVVPLDEVPVELPENISIAALSPRQSINEVIYMNVEAEDDDMDFRLKKGAQIAVCNERQQYQLSQLRPDLSIMTESENVDAFFSKFGEHVPSGKKAVRLNPKEFIPAAGFGVFAWLTLSENVELRKLIRDFHHKETGLLTNIERNLIKLNDNPDLKILGAYAYKSKDEHFHLFACGLYDDCFISHRISQTTTANICENMLQHLNTAITG